MINRLSSNNLDLKNILFFGISCWLLVLLCAGCTQKQEVQIPPPNPNDPVITSGELTLTVADVLTAVQEEHTFTQIYVTSLREDEPALVGSSQDKPSVLKLLKTLGEKLVFDTYYSAKAVSLGLDQTSEFKDYVKDIVKSKIYQKLVVEDILKGIHFTDDDARQYYNLNKNKYKDKNSDQLVLSAIYVKTDHQTEEQARAIIREAYQKLQAGEKFEDVAVQYSEAELHKRGKSATYPIDEFNNPEIVQRLKTMKDGQYSEFISSNQKFIIYKRHEYIPPKFIPFQMKRNSILEQMTRDQQDREIIRLQEKLTEKFKPSLFEDLIANYDPKNNMLHVLSLPGVYEITLERFLQQSKKYNLTTLKEKTDYLHRLSYKYVFLAEAYERGGGTNKL